METVCVPYHLDQFIPGFDVGVPIDTEIRVDLPDAGTWQRMGLLYNNLAQVIRRHRLPVLVVSGDCTTSLGVIAGLQRAGRESHGRKILRLSREGGDVVTGRRGAGIAGVKGVPAGRGGKEHD